MSARLLSGLCLLLCACGGGGGGGGGSAPEGSGGGAISDGGGPAEPAFTPAGQAWADAVPFIKVRGQSVQASWTTTSSGQVRVNAFGAPRPATLTAETDDIGDLQSVELQANGQRVTLDPDLNGRISVEGGADRSVVAIFTDPSNSPLEYSSFGIWLDTEDSPDTSDGRLSAGSFGTPTPTADRPNGDATYHGVSEGTTGMGGDPAITTSSIQVRVTDGFTRVQVDSSGTEAISFVSGSSGPVNLPGHDFSANGQITSQGYEARGDGMTVNGDFYGPNAEETVGVFHGRRDGENYGGAFGAVR